MEHPRISEMLSGLDVLSRLWRRRRVFAVIFLATIGATILALIVLPVSYLATASVIVAEQEPGVTNASPAWAQKIGDPADLESQLLVIRSPRLLRQVMTAPGIASAVVEECEHSRLLSSTERCQKLAVEATSFVQYVENHYVVASAGRSRVINISYQSPSPETAQKLANALTSAFLDDQRAEGANGREIASSWLWQQVRQLDAELREADEKIQRFRRNKGLMRGANAPITSERLTSIGQQLAAAEAARAEALARLQEIKSEQAHGPTDAPSVLSSRTIADLKQQLTTVSAQLASAATMLGPKHPSILQLSREQGLIQQRLADEMQSIAAAAQKAYDADEALVRSLNAQMESAKAEAGSATLDEASIESMVRDTELKRQQYAELYKKAGELETERRVLLGSTRLVSLAEVPSNPFFPKKIPFLAAGLTLALIFAVAGSLVTDHLQRGEQNGLGQVATAATAAPSLVVVEPGSGAVQRIPKSAADFSSAAERTSLLARMAGAPVVARLPELNSRHSGSAVAAILRSHVDVPLREALRLAETDIGFQDALENLARALRIGEAGRGGRILFTSVERGEGKTVTTLALARHLAHKGRRVLAVECDLLNPAFAQAFSVEGPGLLGLLGGSLAARAAALRTAIPNLDVIVAGGMSVKSADLLFGKSVGELFSGIQDYDVVLIESPLPSGKTKYLAGLDCVVLCMRSGGSLVGRAPQAVMAVRSFGAPNIAIAVTMEKKDSSIAPRPRLVHLEKLARAG